MLGEPASTAPPRATASSSPTTTRGPTSVSGDGGDPERTYRGMLPGNVRLMVTSLGGNAGGREGLDDR
jgi:hypothetical protein